MNIFAWILIGWMCFSALITVVSIGQPKKPVTPAVAAGALILQGVTVWFVVLAATH